MGPDGTSWVSTSIGRHRFPGEAMLTRREFVVMAAAGVVHWRRPFEEDVEIVEFAASGKRLGKSRVPKVVKSEAEWKRQLSPLAFFVARQGGTERPFSGEYWNLHD